MGMGRRSTARIGGWLVLAAVMLAAVTVTAVALTRGTSAPPRRPLAVAIHDALTGKPVDGVSAHFTVTQHLLPGASNLLSQSPLLGASGDVWASGHRVKLVVHSQLGTAELAFDGHTVTLYQPKQHAAYVLRLPHHVTAAGAKDATDAKHASGIPSVAEINHAIAQLGSTLSFSGAIPGTMAGRPEYTVKIRAKHDSGLVGPLASAWDAAHGTPLRVALYPRHSGTPAIDFSVTHISYGKLPERDMLVALPHGTKVTTLHLPSKSEIMKAKSHFEARVETAAKNTTSQFPAVAPATLAGMPRTVVRRMSSGANGGAIAVYGHGLGSIVVIEHAATSTAPAGAGSQFLPDKVTVGTASGNELETTLGTIVSFTRGGISYTVLGSQPASTILSAARALR